jgi:hypothetical protein
VLRQDILNGEKENVILDHTYAITRRVGLAQLPLACVALRYLQIATGSWGQVHTHTHTALDPTNAVLPPFEVLVFITRIVCIFGVLLVLKIGTGVGLFLYSARIHNQGLKETSEMPVPHSRSASMERLANIERYTLWKGRIVG